MNKSIQQEIAAPSNCNKKFWLIVIIVNNLLILASVLTILTLDKLNYIENTFITVPLSVCLIVSIALMIAVLLRKHHVLMLMVLTVAALDSAILLLYHSISTQSKQYTLIWHITTIIMAFGVLIFALLFIGIRFSSETANKRYPVNTRYLTYCAMFTALAVICKMIGNAVSNTIPFLGVTFKLTVVYIPWVLGGLVLGPIGGFAAAAIGDFLGQLAVSAGMLPFLELTLSNGLFAVFPALLYKLIKIEGIQKRAIISITIGTIISLCICTLGISSYTLYTRLDIAGPFWAYLATRLSQSIVVFINIPLIALLIPPLIKARIIHKPRSLVFD